MSAGDCLALHESTFALFPQDPDDANQTIPVWPKEDDPFSLGNADVGPPTILRIPRRGIFSMYLTEDFYANGKWVLRRHRSGGQFPPPPPPDDSEGGGSDDDDGGDGGDYCATNYCIRQRRLSEAGVLDGRIQMSNVALIDVAVRGNQDDQSVMASLSIESNHVPIHESDFKDRNLDSHPNFRTAPRSTPLDLRGLPKGCTAQYDGFILKHNVIVGSGRSGWSPIRAESDAGCVKYQSNLVIGGSITWPCFRFESAVSAEGNVAAGCAGTAYWNVGEHHSNNSAHNNLHGIDNYNGGATQIRNFTLWRSKEFAIWSLVEYPSPDSMQIRDVKIADARNGIFHAHVTNFNPTRSVGSYVYVNDSLIVAHSRFTVGIGCAGTQFGSVAGIPKLEAVIGVWAPYFGIKGYHKYPAASKYHGKKKDPIKTPEGLVKHGEVYFTNVNFAEFNGLCGHKTYAIHVNPNCLDNNPPTYFERIGWYNVDEAHKLYMPPPDPKHINLAGCFTMDCGGERLLCTHALHHAAAHKPTLPNPDSP